MIRKFIPLVLITACALTSSILPLFAFGSFSSLRCDMMLESPVAGRQAGKLFIKGDKSRIELNASGMDTITIVTGQNAYMYMPAQNTAISMSLAEAKSQVPDMGDYKQSCDHQGREQLEGVECGIYKCASGGEEVTVWVPLNSDFPLKVVNSAATTYYRNIELNIPLSDELFVLPEGVQYQDMSNLMQGFQGLLDPGAN